MNDKTTARRLKAAAGILGFGVMLTPDEVDWPLRLAARALSFAADELEERDGLTEQDLSRLTAELLEAMEEFPIPQDVMPTPERVKAVRGFVAIVRALAPRRRNG